MINLKDFIDKNSALDTEAFQKAIDLGSERGGEPVFVPFGTYTLSTVVLKDDTNLIFEDGVKIESAPAISDFAKDEPLDEIRYQDLSHSSYTCAMFYADNVKNVKVTGGATINMHSLWDPEDSRAKDGYGRGVKVFSLRKVSGLYLSDFKILYATDIAVLMGACKDVIISRLFINSHIDGISPDCCEDVVISDCIIKTGDDALVFKASLFDRQRRDCQRITVNNCVMSSRANAIKFGTESAGDFKYINVSNCVVLNTLHSGIAIESADGANIYGINISNVTMCNVANPIFIYLSERMRCPSGTKMGTISDVNISNVFADVHDKEFKTILSGCPQIWNIKECVTNKSYPSVIMSTSEENKIKNVTLNNVHLRVLGGGSKDMETVIPPKNGYPECDRFKLPCYGMYTQNTENLKLDNVTYTTVYPDTRVAEIRK